MFLEIGVLPHGVEMCTNCFKVELFVFYRCCKFFIDDEMGTFVKYIRTYDSFIYEMFIFIVRRERQAIKQKLAGIKLRINMCAADF
jgi:hypothetical protein